MVRDLMFVGFRIKGVEMAKGMRSLSTECHCHQKHLVRHTDEGRDCIECPVWSQWKETQREHVDDQVIAVVVHLRNNNKVGERRQKREREVDRSMQARRTKDSKYANLSGANRLIAVLPNMSEMQKQQDAPVVAS